jgi:hypothetical protein
MREREDRERVAVQILLAVERRPGVVGGREPAAVPRVPESVQQKLEAVRRRGLRPRARTELGAAREREDLARVHEQTLVPSGIGRDPAEAVL